MLRALAPGVLIFSLAALAPMAGAGAFDLPARGCLEDEAQRQDCEQGRVCRTPPAAVGAACAWASAQTDGAECHTVDASRDCLVSLRFRVDAWGSEPCVALRIDHAPSGLVCSYGGYEQTGQIDVLYEDVPHDATSILPRATLCVSLGEADDSSCVSFDLDVATLHDA